jgi:large subunit ribosomal protein L17
VGIVKKLFDQIAPRFAKRPGGYTRILRLGACRWEKDENSDYSATRLGDASERVIFELVDRVPAEADAKDKAKAEDKGADKPKKKEKAAKNRGPKAPRAKAPMAKTSQTKK